LRRAVGGVEDLLWAPSPAPAGRVQAGSLRADLLRTLLDGERRRPNLPGPRSGPPVAGRGRASLRVLLGGGTPADRSGSSLYLAALVTAIVVSVITLGTYQVFHNGLWGELYNASKTPHVVLSNPSVDPAEQQWW